MEEEQKKYGLFTAIALTIGIVIGSGIFFKSEEIAGAIGSNMLLGVLAWVTGGIITMSMAYTFAILATKIDVAGGPIGYAEVMCNKKYSKVFGGYLALIYFPITIAILAWVAATYTTQLLDFNDDPIIIISISAIYIALIYFMNIMSPKIAGHFAVSTVVIKLIPLILMGVVGIILGITNGTTLENINSNYQGSPQGGFFIALIATSFAFGGWLDGATLSSAIKNPKKNLPIAMTGGVLLILVIYVLYYLGTFGALNIVDMSNNGTILAFERLFGHIAGPILFVFIIISCLGSCNGLTMAGSHSFELMLPKKVNKKNAQLIYLVLIILCLLIWGGNYFSWWNIPLSNSVVIIFNILLIPIMIGMMIKLKELKVFNRFVMPSIAILGALFLFTSMILIDFFQII